MVTYLRVWISRLFPMILWRGSKLYEYFKLNLPSINYKIGSWIPVDRIRRWQNSFRKISKSYKNKFTPKINRRSLKCIRFLMLRWLNFIFWNEINKIIRVTIEYFSYLSFFVCFWSWCLSKTELSLSWPFWLFC